MSKKQGFVLNRSGLYDLMRSGEMGEVLKSYARQVATRAGEGYDVYVGPHRANVSVKAGTDKAKADNLEHNTLEKAVRGK